MNHISPLAAVRNALAAAHATQSDLNAFISFDDERALARAETMEDRMASGENVGPLAGVPVAVKDLIDHEGRVTTNGSAFFRETATSTAPCVAGLEDAGAIVIGRTGLHEWAFGFSSENPHFGPVRNPWDHSTSVGGSSGGSAAAVAAGVVPIAVGTDTGGSVRVPAALCGTFGLKVTHGRISLEGVFPLVPSIDTVGPLANSVENIARSYRAMSGDQTPEPDQTEPLRFGIPEPWVGNAPLDDHVGASFQAAITQITALGHKVHPLDLPDIEPSHQIWNSIAEEARDTHREFRHADREYGADIRQRLDDADSVTDAEIAEARLWQAMVRQRFHDAFETIDYILTPTVPVQRKVIGEDYIGDLHYRAVISYFSAIVNHSLHPSLAMPLADTGQPPASLQVIGPLGSEPSLISLGRHLETENVVRFRTSSPKFT